MSQEAEFPRFFCHCLFILNSYRSLKTTAVDHGEESSILSAIFPVPWLPAPEVPGKERWPLAMA